MLTGQNYKDAVYGFWANSFGCQPEDFANPCTWVKRQEDMLDTGNSVLYHMGKASIIRIDPPWRNASTCQPAYSPPLPP